MLLLAENFSFAAQRLPLDIEKDYVLNQKRLSGTQQREPADSLQIDK